MKIFWLGLVLVMALGCGSREQAPPAAPPAGSGSSEPAPPIATSPAPPVATSPEPGTPPVPGPGSTNGGSQCSAPAPGPGYECVRNCGPPVARPGDPDPGFSWLSAEQAQRRKQFGCPICLPEDALIETPQGEVRISRLEPKMAVTSTTEDGRRIVRRVEQVVSVQAPVNHQLAVIELTDGRRLRASPGHPDAGGKPVGRLRAGDALDGSIVKRTVRVPYSGRTFDLVLEGGASYYFADRIRVRSSLAH